MHKRPRSPWVDRAVDRIGNVYGEDTSLPCVLMGSHIDTVATGGAFDGTLGVLGGIEVEPDAACVTVGDRAADDAARELAGHGVDAGPCGAAALAALDMIRPEAGSTVLLLVTEGSAANPTRPASVPGPRS
ncbi:hypothetical protein [Virgisporangium ochraceum]|uniref:M20/M25/M40 family metallo-hydrolase n=1 Tax=Virgisporangium ochraceum TaxID=65505 RepID=A0A8J3ZN54_9ACTN|nr:hypothetical protein [Virgisporangium ochraceum]GIJ67127.1 hypothetical protein Voc01_020440 [Virgisporangium ochraceum]